MSCNVATRPRREEGGTIIDGTYGIELDSPLGRKRGTVTLRTEGDRAIADIDAPVVGKQHVEVRVEGDHFMAEGSFRLMLLGKVTYSLRGEVEGDDLRISIDSSKGAVEVQGKRI